MRVLALILGISFAVDAWAACTPMPSCEELNYTDTNCDGEYITCPFDQTKKKCLSSATCKEYDCSAYSLSSCPTTATSCTACGNGLEIGYKVNGCKSGYEFSGGTCVASNCSGYTLSSCPTGATCLTCASGSTTKYKFNGCKSPYAQDGDSCYDCATMKTKLDTGGTDRTVYAYCGYRSGTTGCGYTVFGSSENQPMFCSAGVNCQSLPIYETYDCCKVGLCFKIKEQYEAAVKRHNQLCSDSYKVQRQYGFNCQSYIPASSTGTSGIPSSHSCPSEFDTNPTCVSYSGSYY